MGFSRQEYWSGLPFPSPGDLPDPGIEPRSPALQADALTSEPPGKPHTHLGMLIKLSSNCPAQETDSQSHLLLTCYSSFSVQSSSSHARFMPVWSGASLPQWEDYFMIQAGEVFFSSLLALMILAPYSLSPALNWLLYPSPMTPFICSLNTYSWSACDVPGFAGEPKACLTPALLSRSLDSNRDAWNLTWFILSSSEYQSASNVECSQSEAQL